MNCSRNSPGSEQRRILVLTASVGSGHNRAAQSIQLALQSLERNLFDTHRMWVKEPCERYFTATEEGRVNLAGWGVPMTNIFATGIPIHPAFSSWKSPADCRRAHGLASDRPVVLQMSGGAGFGPVEAVHERILQTSVPLNLVCVVGRNPETHARVELIPCPPRHRRSIIGFTEQIDELMGAADVMVSKPGDLTTAEALARGAAMMVVDPIPGQESRNSDYLLENGAAIKVNNLSSLPMKLEAALREPGRLEQMRGNAKRLGRPHAALDVA